MATETGVIGTRVMVSNFAAASVVRRAARSGSSALRSHLGSLGRWGSSTGALAAPEATWSTRGWTKRHAVVAALGDRRAMFDRANDPRRRFLSGDARGGGVATRVVAGGGGGGDTGVEDERIVDLELHLEASQSYLSYAMSVIVGRALPDVRDGLKPVHRRILYAMHDLGLDSKKPFKKCARVVGEVLGKFHPHGDQSVYDALVRMAQDFSMSSALVDGHGNFGSLDADPPAAMRYTECRLKPAAEAMLLADIALDAVDFTETFDGSQTEPAVLPARLPNLLINGSTGIAVGMATSIPPHNLREVANALVRYASDPENCTLEDLLEVMPAPDFPTAGIIVQQRGGFKEMYRTGKGGVNLRGAATVEKVGGGKNGTVRDAVVITSIPYQTNKASLCEQIADLVNSRTIEGVSDVRDESDRDGMRVVVEIRRGTDADFVREQLYARTKLQTRVSVNLVGLVGREPKILSLMDIMREFLAFRCESIERRARHELQKASSRLHVVEGYLAVQAAPDAVVATIRAAKDGPDAQAALQEKPFWLSEKQAEAVLAMPLRRLTGLEHDKLKAEEADLTARVNDLTGLLGDRTRVIATVASEAKELRDTFGIDRRTEIDTSIADAASFHPTDEDGVDIPLGDMTEAERAMRDAQVQAKKMNVTLEMLNSPALVIMTNRGYIKRIDPAVFSKQGRATRGRNMGKMRGGDEVTKVTHCNGMDTVLFFTDRGRVHAVRAYNIPQASTSALGTPFTRVLKLSEGESITAMLPVDTTEEPGKEGETSLCFVTARGLIKKTCASEFVSIRNNGKKALGLRKGDRLKHVNIVKKGDGIIIGGIDGSVIHFDADSVRAQGRAAAGVKAMAFKPDGLDDTSEDDDTSEALPANVAGMAVVPASVVQSLGLHKASAGDDDADEEGEDEGDAKGPMLFFVSSDGRGKRISVAAFAQQSRAGRGKKGIGLMKGSKLTALCLTGLDSDEHEHVIIGSQGGVMNRYDVASIRPQSGRAAKGVNVMKLSDDDTVRDLTLLPAELGEDE